MRVIQAFIIAGSFMLCLSAQAASKHIGTITVKILGGETVQAEVRAERVVTGEDEVTIVSNPYLLINRKRYDFAVSLPVQMEICKFGKLGDFADASSSEWLNDSYPMVEFRDGHYFLDKSKEFSARLNGTMCGGDGYYTGGGSKGDGYGDNAHGGDT